MNAFIPISGNTEGEWLEVAVKVLVQIVITLVEHAIIMVAEIIQRKKYNDLHQRSRHRTGSKNDQASRLPLNVWLA